MSAETDKGKKKTTVNRRKENCCSAAMSSRLSVSQLQVAMLPTNEMTENKIIISANKHNWLRVNIKS